jgi:hypothetical protein
VHHLPCRQVRFELLVIHVHRLRCRQVLLELFINVYRVCCRQVLLELFIRLPVMLDDSWLLLPAWFFHFECFHWIRVSSGLLLSGRIC